MKKDITLYSKAKIMGHPMLVAYPVAFYTATPIAYLVYAATGYLFWFRVGVIFNIAGVVTALIAAIPGFVDWAFGVPNEHPGKKTGLYHMLANLTALLLFTINAVLQYSKWDETSPELGAALVLTLSGVIITMVAGFLGWKMIGTHHVGVEMTPEQRQFEPIPKNK